MLLEVRQLGVQRGRRVLARQFNCQLNTGECVWLRGKNGGGKTSLLLTLSGLLPSESGQIFWQGREFTGNDPSMHALWYFCPHVAPLKNTWSVAENIQAALKMAAIKLDELTVQHAAQTWGVTHMWHKSAQTLSQGQRRRAALLRLALLPFRPVWLLDEPFDALDTEAHELLAQLMNQQVARDGAILFTSHIQPPSALNIARELAWTGIP